MQTKKETSMKRIRISAALAVAAFLAACGGGGSDGGGSAVPFAGSQKSDPAQVSTADTPPPVNGDLIMTTAVDKTTGLAFAQAVVAAPVPVEAAVPTRPYLVPDSDPFYAQPSAMELAAYPPGAPIRYRKVTAQALYVFPILADAWQVIYRSNDDDDLPVANSTTILVPRNAPATNRKLVSFQAAYDSTTTACNPSYGLLKGAMYESAEIPAVLAKGWVMVVPDYEGPKALFGARKTTAHAILDGIRAAQNFPLAGLAGAQTPVVMMGYSGGALATALAAEVHPGYASELAIKGATLGGLPASPLEAVRAADGGLFSSFMWIPLLGIDRAVPSMQLSSFLNDKGRAAAATLGQSCLLGTLQGATEAAFTEYTLRRLREFTNVPDVLAQPSVAEAFAQNAPGQTTPTIPLFIYTGIFEEVLPIPPIRQLARKYCTEGVDVKTQTVFGGHVIGIVTGLPLAVDYLADRIAGRTVPNNCPD
jgi:hypothetical protein